MLLVNIFDNTCQHHLREDGYWTSTANRKPKDISFIQRAYDFDGITLFTDDFILSNEVDRVKSKIKIAWCLESPAVQPVVHNNIHLVENKFDYIFTYRQDLIQKNPSKYIPNSPGGSLIYDSDISLYSDYKVKKCSMIVSGKKTYPGHILRHTIMNSNPVGVDFYGWGSKFGHIENKLHGLKDYKFHFVIENIRENHYFTEKLIDCLVTGCIPIFYGAPNIDQYFNTDGFIIFDSLKSLGQIKLTDDDFFKRKKVIEENYTLAKKYLSSDDYLRSKINKYLNL